MEAKGRQNRLREEFDAYRVYDHDDDELLSPIALAQEPIDESLNLLGHRYLERESGMLVNAPAGIGKSVFDIQASVLWGCGRSAFGIECAHPLTQIIFQREDSRNDMMAMARVATHLKLTPQEIEMVHRNVRINRLVGKAGKYAIDEIRRLCDKWKRQIDVIHLNPIATYMQGDFQGDSDTNTFLYHQLSPLLHDYWCGLLGISHTNKSTWQGNEEMSDIALAYLMSGRAPWQNWARSIIGIYPAANQSNGSSRVFAFKASKRSNRLGWGESTRYFKWAGGLFVDQYGDGEQPLIWLPCQKIIDTTSTSRIDPIGFRCTGSPNPHPRRLADNPRVAWLVAARGQHIFGFKSPLVGG